MANLKEKTGIWAQIIVILALGLIVSIATDSELLGSLRTLWEESDPEVMLEYLSLGLGFLALTLLVVWLVIRSARGE